MKFTAISLQLRSNKGFMTLISLKITKQRKKAKGSERKRKQD